MRLTFQSNPIPYKQLSGTIVPEDIPLDDVIPIDPQEFYQDFGFLTHPNTGEPVTKLTDYQYEIWNAKHENRYRLVLKTQKVGLSTSVLLEDFQSSLTDC